MKSRVRIALACFLVFAASMTHADTTPLPILSWGSFGNAPGQFYNAQGLAVDGTGRVYVVDVNLNRVQVFSRTGFFLFQWGVSGSGNGQFQGPIGVAVDPAGNVYITDGSNQRVQKFTGEGEYITQWGVSGSGPGEFSQPTGIATDDDGHVFVADMYNYRIQKFTDTGDFLAQWGAYGGGPGEFANPNGIATDPDGNVYVTDTYSYRVQKFDNAGTFLTQWGSYGAGEGQFSSPIGIAADDSAVYVVEQQNQRAQKFSHDGEFILKWGSPGSSLGRFNYPYGLALDDSSNVYITDSGYRIQKFGRRVTARISVPGDFSTIGQAILAAGFGDTIVVDPGVYYEQVNTQGKAMVLASRFVDTGDPADIDNTVIDGQGYGTPLTCSSNEDLGTHVVGFTLRNGQGYYGGGIACNSGSPRLEHLIVRGNGAYLGGGVFIGFSSAPEFLSCTIAGNRANTGGGIFNFSSSVVGTPTQRCNIYDNRNISGPDLGADLYGQGYPSTVYVDTFTTTRFDEAQVHPTGITTIDALHSHYPEISAHDIYVSPSGDNGNDGLTPGSALRNIFAAILRAAPLPGDSITIHVAAGLYSPSANEERTLHPRSFVSVAGEDSGTTIVDGDSQIGMVYCDRDSVFDLSNLTFRNGIMAGGAIHVERSSPRITRCVIRAHISYSTNPGDAGIYCVNASNPTIQECTFAENYGPGIWCEQSSHPTIRDNLFVANARGGVMCGSGSSPVIEGNTIIGAPGGYGSGIEVRDFSNAWIYGNTIVGNSAARGGGIAVNYADPVIRGNTLVGNVASSGFGDHGGGGIWCQDSHAVIDSNRFEGNRATGSLPEGGAVFCKYQGPTITRNTFVDNVAQDTVGYLFAIGRGGAIFIQLSNPVIGGGPGLGNTFSGNFAVVGADLYWTSSFAEAQHAPIASEAHHPSEFVTAAPVAASALNGVSIDATFNHFRVYPVTAYYATPLSAFNLSDGTGDVAPFAEDAYVSPTGDDGNTGTSPDSPLRTIQSALSRMLTTSGTPHAVHVAAGTYSPSLTGERFPVPMPSYASLRGAGSRESILDAEGTATVVVLDGVTDVTISGLRMQGGRAGAGGGVFCRASACSLLDNAIRGNTASLGGGIYCTQGGAAIVANNQIVMNRASGPSGYARVGGGLTANDHANVELTNNVIALNIAGEQGGGLVIWNQSTARMVNNTVAFNLANVNGGALNIFDSPVEIRNSILHSNVSGVGGQISGAAPNVTYSNVEGGWPGTGNLNVDPLFDEAAFLHLGPGSPCIDAGDPTATENDPEDPSLPGMARLPALGTVCNDMGAFGGPGAGGNRGDVPTATLLSLTSASAGPEGVSLTWYGAFGMFSDVVVQRRALDSEWIELGPATVEGTGAIRFVDTDVEVGATFLYRLEYQMGGYRQVTDEVLIRIPAASTFALRGLRPNPAVDGLVVDFTLPTRESARIELLDITGRRVLSRDVGQLGAGRHLVEIGRVDRMAPGLYFLRLQQGGRFKTAKAIVAR